jgi:hypothetical protein
MSMFFGSQRTKVDPVLVRIGRSSMIAFATCVLHAVQVERELPVDELEVEPGHR